MKLRFTDYNYCLEIEADPDDRLVQEAARELNGFWSGDDSRLLTAQIALGLDRQEDPRVLLAAAGTVLTSAAISAALTDQATNLDQLKAWFRRGQEGYPTDLAPYGITLLSWQIELPSTADIEIEELE